jgi:hypothetical protein
LQQIDDHALDQIQMFRQFLVEGQILYFNIFLQNYHPVPHRHSI